MKLNNKDLEELHGALLAAYADPDELRMRVGLGTGRAWDDVVRPNLVRKTAYFDLVDNANRQGWIRDLMEAVLNDPAQQANDALLSRLRRLTPMVANVAIAPHLQLAPDGQAYANRISLRELIGRMATLHGPRVLVLRNAEGASRCGTSYSWYLVNSVAREAAQARRAYINFDHEDDVSPAAILKALAQRMRLGDPPVRADLPAEEQVSNTLVRWLFAQAEAAGTDWWITLDNAHRARVPQPTRDMIFAMARSLSAGTIDNVRLIVLGYADRMPNLMSHAREIPLSPITEHEVLDFFEQIVAQHGEVPDFESPQSAVAQILDGLDLSTNEPRIVSAVTQLLNGVVARLTA